MAHGPAWMAHYDAELECALEYFPPQAEMKRKGRLEKLVCLSIFRPKEATETFSHTKYWQGVMGWLEYGPRRFPGFTIRIYFDASLCDVEEWQGVLRRMADRATDRDSRIQLVKFTCPEFLVKSDDGPCTFHTGLFGTMVRFLGWFEDPVITKVVAFRDLDLTPLKEDCEAVEAFARSGKRIGMYDWYAGGVPARLACFSERVQAQTMSLVAAGLWCAAPLGRARVALWQKMMAMYKDDKTKECMLFPKPFGVDEIILNTTIWDDLKLVPSNVDFMPTWLAGAMQHFSVDGTPFDMRAEPHKRPVPPSRHPDAPLTLTGDEVFFFDNAWRMTAPGRRGRWKTNVMDLSPRDTCAGIQMLLTWIEKAEHLTGQWMQLHAWVSRVMTDFMLHRRGLNLGSSHDTRAQRRVVDHFLQHPTEDIRFHILSEFQQFLLVCDKEGFAEGLRRVLHRLLRRPGCSDEVVHFTSRFLCQRRGVWGMSRDTDRGRLMRPMVETLIAGVRDRRLRHALAKACGVGVPERERDRDRDRD